MKIVFLNGADAGRSVELTPSGLTIGRETDNHLQLPVGGVSRYHARIEFVEGAYMLRDLGSTNGTKLNGEILQKLEALKANDIIAIGEQQFRVVDPIPAGGKSDSKIGSTTVKIPANVPVPEPAAPQFVFRPDSEIQPPPPPPVTDSSETATVNIAPDLAEAGGSDFFAKRDGDGNLFKKDDDKKNVGKSTLRGNLIFVLIILVMIIGGIALFVHLNTPNKKNSGKNRKNEQSANNENGGFFFYYETQSYDDQDQSLIKKKVYCRQVEDSYQISMQYNHYGKDGEEQSVVRIMEEEECPLELVVDYRKTNDIVRFVEENLQMNDPVGNAKTWTRLAIGDGQNISDVTVSDGNEPSSFHGAEEKIKELVMTVTENGQRMRSPKDIRKDADRAFGEADAALRGSEPQSKANALEKFNEAAASYYILKSPKDQKRFEIAYERAKQLREELSAFYLEGMQKANAAYNKRNYQEAIDICQKYKNHFTGERRDAFDAFISKSQTAEREKKSKKGK